MTAPGAALRAIIAFSAQLMAILLLLSTAAL